jgi:hypothetical protein
MHKSLNFDKNLLYSFLLWPVLLVSLPEIVATLDVMKIFLNVFC